MWRVFVIVSILLNSYLYASSAYVVHHFFAQGIIGNNYRYSNCNPKPINNPLIIDR